MGDDGLTKPVRLCPSAHELTVHMRVATIIPLLLASSRGAVLELLGNSSLKRWMQSSRSRHHGPSQCSAKSWMQALAPRISIAKRLWESFHAQLGLALATKREGRQARPKS